MKTRISKTLSRPFVLSGEQIRSITDVIGEDGNEIEVEVLCSDDARREFDTVDELLRYENPNDARINELVINSRPPYDRREDGCTSKLIFCLDEKLSKDYDVCSISTEFYGPDDKVMYMKKRILEKIQGTRPWYSCVSRINGYHAFAVVFVVLYVSLDVLLSIAIEGSRSIFLKHDKPYSEYVLLNLFGVAFVFFVLFVPVSYISGRLIRFRRSKFRSGIFLIGQQADFEKDRDHWRHLFTKTLYSVLGAGLLGILGILWNLMKT